MIRRPPRSTQSRSSAASDVYKRQIVCGTLSLLTQVTVVPIGTSALSGTKLKSLIFICCSVDICAGVVACGVGSAGLVVVVVVHPLINTNITKNPVSYTHLRAHETRHDLVCRLLLDKKKIVINF